MATATWTCNKDARVATSSGSDLGAGASDYNPCGLYQGYLYRTLLGFAYSFAGMVAITHAELRFRTSTQSYVQFGSDPDLYFQRLSANWSEGSSVGLSGSNAVKWSNQPGVTGTRHAVDVPTTESTWVYVDVTSAIQEAKAAGVFYGFRVWAQDEGSSSDVTEMFSREQGGNDPYIVVTYDTNTAPNVPTAMSPVGGAAGSPTPTLRFTHSDSDGDALLNYDLQVSSDPAFAVADRWNASRITTGIAANSVACPYAGAALTRGSTYYWRARTYSASGVLTAGPYSAVQSFRVVALPVLTLTSPSGPDALIEMSKAAGDGLGPRMVVRWTYVDPEGGQAASWRVVVQTDALGAFYDSGVVAGSVSSLVVPVDAVRAAFYRVTVTAVSALGESVTTGPVRCKAQWTVAEYRSNDLGAVTVWSAAASSTAGAGQGVVTEYARSSAGGAIATWQASLSSVGALDPLHNYFHWRVFLFAWGAGATSPSFDRMALTYTSATGVPPDGWTVTGQHSIDTSTKVYGTQSLKAAGNGASQNAYQQVAVQKNTDYILSGRIKSDGPTNAQILLSRAGNTGGIIGHTPVTATQDWTRVQSGVWNSGDNESVFVRINTSGAVGTTAWFDALKLEASRVATQWIPGLVGYGLSVDAGGIKVDASAVGQATLRLQGSDGAVRSIVELGVKGLKFGGDTELSSPSLGVLAVNTVPLWTRPSSAAFPVSPADGDIWFRTDLDRWFTYDATTGKWLTEPFIIAFGMQQNAAITVTTTGYARAPAPGALLGGTQLFIKQAFASVYASVAQSGANYWTSSFLWSDTASGAGTSIGSFNTQAQTVAGRWRQYSVNVNALVPASAADFEVNAALTGTGGSMFGAYGLLAQWALP